MPRINLTLTDDNYEFLKRMKNSGTASSLSHAVRLAIQEYRWLHEKGTRGARWDLGQHTLAGTVRRKCTLCSALEEEIRKARRAGEVDREHLLRFLLEGHRQACHYIANNSIDSQTGSEYSEFDSKSAING